MLGTPEKIRLNLNFWLLAEHFCVFIIKKNISNRLSKVLISTSDVCKWKSEVLIIYNDLYKHLGFGPAKENIIWMHCWISNIQMRSAQMRISISNWILLTFCISCLWSRNPYIYRISDWRQKQGEVERTPDTVIDCKLGGAVGLHDWHLKGGSPNQEGHSKLARWCFFMVATSTGVCPIKSAREWVNPSSLLSSFFQSLCLHLKVGIFSFSQTSTSCPFKLFLFLELFYQRLPLCPELQNNNFFTPSKNEHLWQFCHFNKTNMIENETLRW